MARLLSIHNNLSTNGRTLTLKARFDREPRYLDVLQAQIGAGYATATWGRPLFARIYVERLSDGSLLASWKCQEQIPTPV